MSASKKKISLTLVIVIGVGLFLAGYVAGTFLPFTMFAGENFLGATRDPGQRPGPNTHRN